MWKSLWIKSTLDSASNDMYGDDPSRIETCGYHYRLGTFVACGTAFKELKRIVDLVSHKFI